MHVFITILGWIALLALLVVFLAAGFWEYTGRDRSGGLSTDDPVWAGKFVETIPVWACVTPDRALAVAFAALRKVGSTQAERWDAVTVVGWYNNFGVFARWHLAIVLRSEPDGTIQFLCCCRPRWSRALFDLGVSLNRAKKLAATVTDMTSRPDCIPAPPGGWVRTS